MGHVTDECFFLSLFFLIIFVTICYGKNAIVACPLFYVLFHCFCFVFLFFLQHGQECHGYRWSLYAVFLLFFSFIFFLQHFATTARYGILPKPEQNLNAVLHDMTYILSSPVLNYKYVQPYIPRRVYVCVSAENYSSIAFTVIALQFIFFLLASVVLGLNYNCSRFKINP